MSDFENPYFAKSLFQITFAAMKKVSSKFFFMNFSKIINSIVIVFFFSACNSSRNVVYFNNIADTTFKTLMEVQPVIQKNDLLSISVSSLNPEATLLFNSPNIPTVTSTTANGTSAQMTGYLVNADETIQFPVLGTIKVGGLTKKQLSDSLTKKLVNKKLLVDPIVNVRFLNFRVTVLGEVAKPTVVSVANERISILEAIGLAGDLTIYAKRDNILLIREENNERIVKRVNLNNSDIFNSPYYYLKTNDIVYAEPNKAKISSSSTIRQVLPIVLSSLSLVAIVLTRVF